MERSALDKYPDAKKAAADIDIVLAKQDIAASAAAAGASAARIPF
jgi:hypothetical protein